MLGNYSKIKPIDKSQVSFPHNSSVGTVGTNLTIQEVDKLAPEQVISLKANVFEVSPATLIPTKDGPLPKQSVLLRDRTSCIKLQLFGEAVDSLAEGVTYVIENVRVKVNKCIRYLNTTKSEPFVATETDAIDVIEIDNATSISLKEIDGIIIGVQSVRKYYLCIGCNQKSSVASNDLIKCSNCSLNFKASTCEVVWYAKLMVKDISTKAMYNLSIHNDLITQFFQCSNKTEEDQLAKLILDCNKQVTVKFDSIDQEVLSIS